MSIREMAIKCDDDCNQVSMISGEKDQLILSGSSFIRNKETTLKVNKSKLLSFLSTDSSGTPGSVEYPFSWMSPVKSYMKEYISEHPYWFLFDTPPVRFALSSKTKGSPRFLFHAKHT